MIESQPPADSDYDGSVRVKRFFRGIIKATQRHEEKLRAKESLAKQAEKIKEVVVKRSKKSKIDKELREFDKKLYEFLTKDECIVPKRIQSPLLDAAKEDELNKLNAKIDNVTEKDAYVIETLMNKIRHLENELEITENARHMEEHENKQEILLIENAICDVRERLKKFMNAKNERDRKIEEIERRIEHKVSRHYNEIVNIESMLKLMEEKYESAKEKGVCDRELEERIRIAKQRLIMSKAGISPQEAGFVPTIKREMPPYGKPRLFFKKAEIPKGPVQLVKHDMQIMPVKEQHITLTPGKLPPIPPAPRIPREMMWELKREHIIPTFWETVLKKKPDVKPAPPQPAPVTIPAPEKIPIIPPAPMPEQREGAEGGIVEPKKEVYALSPPPAAPLLHMPPHANKRAGLIGSIKNMLKKKPKTPPAPSFMPNLSIEQEEIIF